MTTITALELEECSPALQDLLRPRVERLGYFGEWFRYTAHQPEALEYFYRFTESLKTTIPSRLVEVVALTVASQRDNRYERHQHEQLCRRLGYDDVWVRRLVGLNKAPVLAEDEAVVRDLAVGLVQRTDDLSARLQAVVDAVGEVTAVGCLLLCARYDAHASVACALDLEPPVQSVVEHTP